MDQEGSVFGNIMKCHIVSRLWLNCEQLNTDFLFTLNLSEDNSTLIIGEEYLYLKLRILLKRPGITGQDGQYLSRYLFEKSYTGHGIIRMSSSAPENLIVSEFIIHVTG